MGNFKADLFILACGDHCIYNYEVIFETSTEIENLKCITSLNIFSDSECLVQSQFKLSL